MSRNEWEATADKFLRRWLLEFGEVERSHLGYKAALRRLAYSYDRQGVTGVNFGDLVEGLVAVEGTEKAKAWDKSTKTTWKKLTQRARLLADSEPTKPKAPAAPAPPPAPVASVPKPPAAPPPPAPVAAALEPKPAVTTKRTKPRRTRDDSTPPKKTGGFWGLLRKFLS